MLCNFKKARVSLFCVIGFVSLALFAGSLLFYFSPVSAVTPANIVNLVNVGDLSAITPTTETNPFHLPILRGLEFNPREFFTWQFYFDSMDKKYISEKDAGRFIKYFFAFLTTPQEDLWCNLSSYEKDRVIPDNLKQLDIGKDLLLEDYLLKKLTSSLTNPNNKYGKGYWQKVNQAVYQISGTHKTILNNFYKVWVIPDKVTIYLEGDKVFVKDAKLKVMLEEDRVAYRNEKIENRNLKFEKRNKIINQVNNAAKEIFKQELLPIIEQQVNNSSTFAPLRQLFYCLSLAAYFKSQFKDHPLYQQFIDKNKNNAVLLNHDVDFVDAVYNNYLNNLTEKTYQFDYQEYDSSSKKLISKRYFSGGMQFNSGFSFLTRKRNFDFSGNVFTKTVVTSFRSLPAMAKVSQQFRCGLKPSGELPDSLAYNCTTDTSLILVEGGWRGLAYDIGLTKLMDQINLKIENKHEKSGQLKNLFKRMEKYVKKEIKDPADVAANDIAEVSIKQEDKVVVCGASEGGRDEVRTFGPRQIINEALANKIMSSWWRRIIHFFLKTIQYGFFDVIEGTNMFVSNINNKPLSGIKAHESGATSSLATGSIVQALGVTPDYYTSVCVFTVSPEKQREFEAVREFPQFRFSLRWVIDFVLFLSDWLIHRNALGPINPDIEDYNDLKEGLMRIAKANNAKINDLEIVLMDRGREKKRTDNLERIKREFEGFNYVKIKDGTEMHGLDATLGNNNGKIKILLTVAGAPEGFTNLAIATAFRKAGAVASLKICSKNVNHTDRGNDTAQDLEKLYNFSAEETQMIMKLRPQDYKKILQGKKIFTTASALDKSFFLTLNAAFPFITNNGVFNEAGMIKKEDGSYDIRVLRIQKDWWQRIPYVKITTLNRHPDKNLVEKYKVTEERKTALCQQLAVFQKEFDSLCVAAGAQVMEKPNSVTSAPDKNNKKFHSFGGINYSGNIAITVEGNNNIKNINWPKNPLFSKPIAYDFNRFSYSSTKLKLSKKY